MKRLIHTLALPLLALAAGLAAQIPAQAQTSRYPTPSSPAPRWCPPTRSKR
ncbi:hypothetical protein ACQ4M4_14570 [Leptolyngbya sp. AN02str]|uniref:hypothetical protein n=1 Tax=Leptolyngbya sp. AN02str TaxID=3423363 RepID=UPI003D31FD7E